MRKFSGILAGSALLFLFVQKLHAQYEAGRAPVRNFLPDEYNAAPQNWAIRQHPSGRIVVANSSGVLFYDGAGWTVVEETTGKLIRSIEIDSAGTVYAGMLGAFGFIVQDSIGRWKFKSLSNNLPKPFDRMSDIWAVHRIPDGVVFRSNAYFYLWKNDTVKVLSAIGRFTASGHAESELFVHDDGYGIFKLVDDSLSLVCNDKRLDGNVIAMVDNGPEGLLIAVENHGFFSLRDSRLVRLEYPGHLLAKDKNAHGISVLANGHIAVATLLDGVWIFGKDGRVKTHLDPQSGLSGFDTKCVFEDREGFIWMGLNSGIARTRFPAELRFFDSRDGLGVAVDDLSRFNGRLFAATSSGIAVLSRGNTPRWQSVPGMRDVSLSLFEFNGELLAATGSGIYSVKDRAERLTPPRVRAACMSRIGESHVIAGLKEGVLFMSRTDGRWNITAPVENIFEQIRTIAVESDSVIWLGTRNRGVLRLLIDTKDPTNILRIDRLGVTAGLPEGGARVSMVDGIVRFSTDKGVYVWSEGRCLPDDSFGPLLSDGSHAVDRFYMRTASEYWAVCVELKKSRERIAIARRQSDGSFLVEWPVWKELEKFPMYTIEFESEVAWIGGPKGIVQMDLNYRFEPVHYQAVFRRVAIRTDSVMSWGGPWLPPLTYDDRHLRFEFAAPSYFNEEAHEYSYKLENFDETWSDWSTENQKDYTNLPEGSYLFLVRARNGIGQLSEIAELKFNINPPWFRTWWALALYVLVGAAVVRTAFVWRTRYLINKTKVLEKSVEERTQRLAEANIEIEAQRDHLKQANDQLESTVRELKETQFQLVQTEKMASVGQMVAGLAHEVNNPLTFVLPNLDYIRNELKKLITLNSETVSAEHAGDLSRFVEQLQRVIRIEDLNEAIDSSIKGGKRIKDIVDNLKWFARLDRQIKTEGMVEDSLDVAIDLFFGQFSHVKWVRDYKFQRSFEADFQEINQALVNILTNAVQAISQAVKDRLISENEGEVRLETVDYRAKEQDYLRISIKDNGIGIAPEHLSRVFEPFFTSKDVGLGKGLGLSEAYAIVNRHGGHIEITSLPGKGTTVDLYLKADGTARPKDG